MGACSPRIRGRLNAGLSALNSSSGISASLAASSMSMSRFFCTATKYGVFSTGGNTTANLRGLAMMFLMACSLGT
ncbi:Uncharacterised protein [Bordetella pertussis]|nr:Uncharacterised protein [Bordetella pertussis]